MCGAGANRSEAGATRGADTIVTGHGTQKMQTTRKQRIRLFAVVLAALALLAAAGPVRPGLTAAQQDKANAALLWLWGDDGGAQDMHTGEVDKGKAAKVTVVAVKAALDGGADVNSISFQSGMCDCEPGYTALTAAIAAGNMDCVKYLASMAPMSACRISRR